MNSFRLLNLPPVPLHGGVEFSSSSCCRAQNCQTVRFMEATCRWVHSLESDDVVPAQTYSRPVFMLTGFLALVKTTITATGDIPYCVALIRGLICAINGGAIHWGYFAIQRRPSRMGMVNPGLSKPQEFQRLAMGGSPGVISSSFRAFP